MLVQCRTDCGACCIAPSINSPIPGMPDGKPAGVRCVNLDEHYRCRLFGQPSRPDLCQQFQADTMVCGDSREQALQLISHLEQITGVQ